MHGFRIPCRRNLKSKIVLGLLEINHGHVFAWSVHCPTYSFATLFLRTSF